MELYTLDRMFLQTGVIDTFTSLIWTERYSDAGEIEVVVPSTPGTRAELTEGTFVTITGSREAVLIDSVDDVDGTITAKGKTLSAFLSERIARNTFSQAASSWAVTGEPAAIAYYIIEQMCMPGGLMTEADILPGSRGLDETIPGLILQDGGPNTISASTTIAVPYGTVFDAVKGVCDSDGLGFTLYPKNLIDGAGEVYFLCYRGVDHTSSQSVNPVVIFEPAMDSFTDAHELRSIAAFKTVAYVWPSGVSSSDQIGTVFAPGYENVTGWDRRTLLVDASDIDASTYNAVLLPLALQQKGKDALANNNYVRMTDGQIVPQNAFRYGIDYNLGDVIELRGNSTLVQKVRITEYIRSQDATGEKAYPTLSVID